MDNKAPQEDMPAAEGPRRLRSADLFGRRNEVEIQHNETLYRLRITRQGKLILHK